MIFLLAKHGGFAPQISPVYGISSTLNRFETKPLGTFKATESAFEGAETIPSLRGASSVYFIPPTTAPSAPPSFATRCHSAWSVQALFKPRCYDQPLDRRNDLREWVDSNGTIESWYTSRTTTSYFGAKLRVLEFGPVLTHPLKSLKRLLQRTPPGSNKDVPINYIELMSNMHSYRPPVCQIPIYHGHTKMGGPTWLVASFIHFHTVFDPIRMISPRLPSWGFLTCVWTTVWSLFTFTDCIYHSTYRWCISSDHETIETYWHISRPPQGCSFDFQGRIMLSSPQRAPHARRLRLWLKPHWSSIALCQCVFWRGSEGIGELGMLRHTSIPWGQFQTILQQAWVINGNHGCVYI